MHTPNCSETLWCLSHPESVHWAEWENEDEAVLYINSTGQTVLVSLLCISLLEILKNSSQTLTTLVQSISQSIDEELQATELQSSIQSTLQQLQQFGAIEQCPSH